MFIVVASSQFVSAQPGNAQSQSGSSPVAYVYATSNIGGSNFVIDAFSADSKGRLTPVPGSPFSTDVEFMALNGKYLFGTDGTNILSFAIGSNGALTQVSEINATQYNNPPGGDGGPLYLFLDHTGATLYDEDVYGNNGANNVYQFFDVNNASGVLTYLGVSNFASTEFWTPLSFTANNDYAYGADCYHFDPEIYGFKRSGSGALTGLTSTPPMPQAKQGDFYCPYLAAADPNNNLAVSVQSLNGNSWGATGPPQLAVYTADASGNLTTTSTYTNMPNTRVQNVTNLAMAPSGKLLAVGGTAGLQVFHFNGSNPITKFTGLLMKEPMNIADQMFWDNDNHLYVISTAANLLYVYTITSDGARKAPGSPYAITAPMNIIVLPKT